MSISTNRGLLAPGIYGFDDLEIGNRIRTGRKTITAELIDSYAEVSGDNFEIHLSEEAAARHGFDGRVAHGLLVLAVVDGLKNQAEARIRAQASLGWEWKFRKPVLAGDSIDVQVTISGKREIRDRSRGILVLDFTVSNQDGLLVQQGTNRLMAYR